MEKLEAKVVDLEARNSELVRRLRHTEGHRTLAIVAYNVATVSGVILLALLLDLGSAFLVPTFAILGGFCAAQLLIREARTTRRGFLSKTLFYAGGLVLALEVVIVLNAIILAAGR